jgi:ribosomal protein S18 acetylase RimI-like enzyme
VVDIPKPTVVRLDENDASDLHELLKITWRDTYAGLLPDSVIADAEMTWHNTETLRRQMKSPTVLFAGIRDAHRLLGMVRAAMVDDQTARIFQLYVLPTHQREGMGTELMNYARSAFPKATKLVLDVTKGDEKGVSFYRKYGFKFLRETTLRVGEAEIYNIEGIVEL